MFLKIFFVFASVFYYLYFVNKGIVLFDEGYYAHIADRIINGQIPYKDFFLQFTPGYFYLLSVIYKIFGEQIIVGRFLTLFICLGILITTLKITDKFNFSYLRQRLLVFLSVISFGFPLINNMSLLAWISVLISLLVIYSYILWFEEKKMKHLVLMSIFLSLLFLFKQNLGIYFLLVFNIFLFLSEKKQLLQKLKSIFILDSIFISFFLVWFIYFFILQTNVGQFVEFLSFNRRYLALYPLSYPPLSFILQPTGFVKLLPYYLPVFLSLFILKEIYKKNNKPIIFFSTISLGGFFGTVFPTSDLLHVYPFFASVLVSGLIFFKNKKQEKLWIIFTIISILIGFYLTFFREYYRYQPKYSLQNTTLNLPRTEGILIDSPLSSNLEEVYYFIHSRTSDKDFIFSYPFSPMLYFVLQRQNPSKFSIYYPGYLTTTQEKETINDIHKKNVKYIVVFSQYKFQTPLSEFIQSQKNVYNRGEFKIFEVK